MMYPIVLSLSYLFFDCYDATKVQFCQVVQHNAPDNIEPHINRISNIKPRNVKFFYCLLCRVTPVKIGNRYSDYVPNTNSGNMFCGHKQMFYKNVN